MVIGGGEIWSLMVISEELYEGLKINNLVNYSQILTGYVGSESFLRKIRDVVMRIKEKNPSAVYCKLVMVYACPLSKSKNFFTKMNHVHF